MKCKQMSMFGKLKIETVKLVSLKMVREDTGQYSKAITNPHCRRFIDLSDYYYIFLLQSLHNPMK
jgi:hypothetical protein